jgi:hypothetical protein
MSKSQLNVFVIFVAVVVVVGVMCGYAHGRMTTFTTQHRWRLIDVFVNTIGFAIKRANHFPTSRFSKDITYALYCMYVCMFECVFGQTSTGKIDINYGWYIKKRTPHMMKMFIAQINYCFKTWQRYWWTEIIWIFYQFRLPFLQHWHHRNTFAVFCFAITFGLFAIG